MNTGSTKELPPPPVKYIMPSSAKKSAIICVSKTAGDLGNQHLRLFCRLMRHGRSGISAESGPRDLSAGSLV